MSETSIKIRPAKPDDREQARTFLRANDLPVEDLEAESVQLFVVDDDGDFLGVGGLESSGGVGLLRSIVVPEENRGEGYGSAICNRLEARAADSGVESLYLLTTTAKAFFRERGYETIPREQVPPAIQATSEFSTICPESASCLRKQF